MISPGQLRVDPLRVAAPAPSSAGALRAVLVAHGPIVLIVAVAAVLRTALLGRTALDPFYDASVRSMGGSWHAFLTGAIDPSAQVAIDKPPVDLWLQVATTKLFGFTPVALLAPAAIGGTLAVLALYDLVRTLAGRPAALAAAATLAVLPLAVITARSDTMDSVMAALVIAALAVAARGLRAGRTANLVAAGALLGLAFEVKLFEALVAAPALALLWWAGSAGSRPSRLRAIAAGSAAFAAVALAWLAVMTLAVGPSQRPWAFGSANGSAWNSTFVYDGWDRLTGLAQPPVPRVGTPGPAAARELRQARRVRARLRGAAPAAAGPLRLVSARAHLGQRVGIALAAAWLALLLVAALRAWVPLDRAGRAGLAALAAWLALGTALFSVQGALRPRYLEAFDGAVAAVFGIGVVLVAAALGRRRAGAGARRAVRAVAALALAAVLVPAAVTSVAAVRHATQDSGTPGRIPPARLATLAAYLRAHQHGARYEVASVAVARAAALIAHDGRPVLLLTTAYGRPLVAPARLARLVRAGAVRTALVGTGCSLASADRRSGCSPVARWIRAHGVDVSRAAGQPYRGLVYALRPAVPHARRAG